MIITLISVGLLITGIICFVAESRNWKCPDWVFALGVVLVVFGGTASITAGVVIADAQINEDIRYQNKLYEREVLEYRIDNMEDNVVGNEMIYDDIVEFNNSLRGVKKWANNPFLNWFYTEEIATIDYIELDWH